MTSQPHLEKRKVLGGGRDPHPSPLPFSAVAASVLPFSYLILAPTTWLVEDLQRSRPFSAGRSSQPQLLPAQALTPAFLSPRCQWPNARLLQPSVRGGSLVPVVGATGLLQARIWSEWAPCSKPGVGGGGRGDMTPLARALPPSPLALQRVSAKPSGRLHDVHPTPKRDRLPTPGPRPHQRHPGLPDPVVSSCPVPARSLCGLLLEPWAALLPYRPSVLPPGGGPLLSTIPL